MRTLQEFSDASELNALLESLNPNAAVYLVGAGGCGMSGLGHLLLDLGHRVAGSDLMENEAIGQLRARGAEIQIGHDAGWIEQRAPALVVYSSAVRPGNPELAAARDRGVPLVRRGLLLAALLRRQCGVAVAGMHGKTTTTALLAFALEQLGAGASYAVGGTVPQLPVHARFSRQQSNANGPGGLPLFVAEADESDGTLRHFAVEHALVLNMDEEHLDHFGNVESIWREFEQFGRRTKGRLVFCADDPHLARLFAAHPGAISYGFNRSARYRVEIEPCHRDRPSGSATRFSLSCGGERIGSFEIGLMGEQNVSNAAGALALLLELGYGVHELGGAVRSFCGAARRQETLYRDDRFHVIEDYGHHPTEIRATLSALRPRVCGRLLVVFQPHRFSRTKALLSAFADCFRQADKLWLTEIYGAGEEPLGDVSGSQLAEAVRAAGQAAEFAPNWTALAGDLNRTMAPGDVVMFLGAGDITKAAHAFANGLRNEWQTPLAAMESRLAARLGPASLLRRDEPLAKRTTLRVGGRADLYVEPGSEEDLATVVKFCGEYRLPFMMLGRGSNLLIRDGGYRGMVICLCRPAFSRIEVAGDRMRCGAGARLKTVAVEARKHGLSGMEFLEGIPGTIGGALRMNAGAMGGWTFQAVESVRYMDCDGNVHEVPSGNLEVEYRQCRLFKDHIALGAVLRGQPAAPEAIAERMNLCSKKRWHSQPAAPSAGCIFKNPPTVPAGKLIEELGLKGTRVGGAVVSDVHGNFIVNDGNATAQDVLDLIELIRARARAHRGIDLETEVQIVGSPTDSTQLFA